jgi:hypothetical protein
VNGIGSKVSDEDDAIINSRIKYMGKLIFELAHSFDKNIKIKR